MTFFSKIRVNSVNASLTSDTVRNYKLLRLVLAFFGLILCLEFTEQIWLLVPVAIATTIGVLVTLLRQSKYIVATPQLILFVYLFQHFIASFILFFYPPVDTYDIGMSRYPAYLAFVLPCCLALLIGFGLAEPRFFVKKTFYTTSSPPQWANNSEQLVWLGIVSMLLGYQLEQYVFLNFFLYLMANLRFVGLFSLILLNNAKWKIYAPSIIFIEIISSSSQAMFGNIIIWSGAMLLILAYQLNWQKRLLAGIFCSFFFLIVFQEAKLSFREFSVDSNVSNTAKVTALGSQIVKQFSQLDQVISPEILSSIMVRFNQGWIIDRILAKVPASKDFARGDTIYEGLYATFIPRFIDPDKPVAGGKLNFERFTGLALADNTSMTIGIIGELYANFGIIGGILGIGCFGYLLGFLYFKFLYNKALAHPVWYAWGPFIGYYAMKAEEGLMETTTWIVKSLIVMVIVIFTSNKLNTRSRQGY